MPHRIAILLCLAGVLLAQSPSLQIPSDDAVRIREFYRLAPKIEDAIWPHWSAVPSPLLLVTAEGEFLTHHSAPPKDFEKVGDDRYARPRQFPLELQATFPAFGPPSVIAIGEPKHTESKTSTPWIITLMHEHFHQLQNAQPEYYKGIESLGLSHGDQSGMWQLNYPFPYEKPEVAEGFKRLRDLLTMVVSEKEPKRFNQLAKQYQEARKRFLARLSSDDHKYFSFQLWQEGIARYTQIMAAEAAASYQPTAEYAALPDYEPFSTYAPQMRSDTLNELKQADLAKWKRIVFYSFGGVEGLVLDRINPKWKEQYFQNMFSTDSYFQAAQIP
jgi:hypothetical protein